MPFVYVDGACLKNGTPDAAAGYGVWFGKNHELNVSEVVSGDKHSNQVAEIQAAKAAIRIAIRENFDSLKIFTDSRYVYMGVKRWMSMWHENGWRTVTGRPVANQEEWEDLDNAIDVFENDGGDIRWVKIKAHNNNFGNEQADRLAKEAAQKAMNNNQGGTQGFAEYDEYYDDYYDSYSDSD